MKKRELGLGVWTLFLTLFLDADARKLLFSIDIYSCMYRTNLIWQGHLMPHLVNMQVFDRQTLQCVLGILIPTVNTHK